MKLDLRSPQIFFENITVNAVDHNAGIFFGKNLQINWGTTIESNHSGFGAITGNHNHISFNTHLVLDDTIVDGPTIENNET